MEQRKPVHGRREISFDLFEALHQHYIFQDAGCRLAVHLGQLEAVPVQVDGMSIVCLVIEEEPIALSPLKRFWRRFLIERGPVDGPSVEATWRSPPYVEIS